MNINQIKNDFPIFATLPKLTYLDSAATALKPRVMIEKEREYYEKYSANIYRGVYAISEEATREFEETREVIRAFINAPDIREIIFTKVTTESINLIAYGLGRQIVGAGDEVVTTLMEHHSNFIPWQQLAFETGADFKVVDLTRDGYLSFMHNGTVNYQELEQVITKKTKIFALTAVSNVLGTINPIAKIVQAIKKINPAVIVVVDAAQAAPHMTIDVRQWGADFVAFSAHKMLGPTGVGVLWGRYELLDQMYPFQYGSEMITDVKIEKSVFKAPPSKFEPGTPNIAGVIAFKEAVRYLSELGRENIRQHEEKLVQYALTALKNTFKNDLTIVGPTSVADRGGVVAFTFKNYHAHDIAQILDEHHIAVRAGHHCAMPLHQQMGLTASTRASFYIYNDTHDIDRFVEGLEKVAYTLQ